MSDNLTPREIVTNLDKYIVGQDKAKRAVAIALRNRYRRSMLEREMQDEITPKNIIMIGPTGVGKTEIARRLSKLMQAPFVKVEATKFTEVGYVGRDVESMIRDLVEASVRMVKNERMEGIREKARQNAEARLIDLLLPKEKAEAPNPFALIFGKPAAPKPDNETKEITVETDEEKQSKEARRAQTIALLKDGKLEHSVIEIDVADTPQLGIEIAGFDGANMNEILSGILPKKTKKRKVTVGEARKILEGEEAEKLIDMDEVTETAINRAEQRGIIFIDEIDKIAGKSAGNGPDVSREGVQRDILPIVEGTTVQTKYGPVKTDFILFIAAGAFHVSKVSDLIPELQGRFPIKVELESLHKEEFRKILTQPDFAITKQYQAMLSVEGVNLIFTDDAIDKIAEVAQIVNESSENIGARRLYTILENLLDDISYNAGGVDTQVDVVIDKNYVSDHLKDDMKLNLDKYIL